MAVLVTIDAGSKADAVTIASALPGNAEARAWRGYGVIRLRFQDAKDARETVAIVGDCVERHSLAWARVRIGDDERMFRSRRLRTT
jgi:hypothetical protein